MADESSYPLWRIEAYKYNNSLHYTMPAYLLERSDDWLRFRTQLGGTLNHLTRGFAEPISRPSEMIFWLGRWYNVYLNFDHAGTFRHFYCNIGLPPTVGDEVISFVDLDLDIRIWADGHTELLDEDEFIAHAAQFNYPPDVRRKAWAAVDQVMVLWRSKTPPFNR